MKKLIKPILVVVGILVAIGLTAQDFSAQVKEKISAFDFMIGEWEGEGWVMGQDGNKETSHVIEDISYQLDETIIQLRGVGMADKDGKQVKVHDAFGILSYDPFTQKYKMNSWLSRGMSTTAQVEIKNEASFIWWFDAGPSRTIRYTVNFEDGLWNEKGEMSTDGDTWHQFFEMNLTQN